MAQPMQTVRTSGPSSQSKLQVWPALCYFFPFRNTEQSLPRLTLLLSGLFLCLFAFCFALFSALMVQVLPREYPPSPFLSPPLQKARPGFPLPVFIFPPRFPPSTTVDQSPLPCYSLDQMSSPSTPEHLRQKQTLPSLGTFTQGTPCRQRSVLTHSLPQGPHQSLR